jgi:Ca2+-binding RTX toxin-like protein
MGYSGVITFGDSLVDPGNALGLADWYDGLPFAEPVDAAPTPDKGYFEGRFTNGFTYADLIANKYLGVATKPIFPYAYEDPYLGIRISPFASDPVGNNLNFAYGGAQMRRGDEVVPDLDGQTDAWRDAVDGDADPNALHIFSFGANDVHDLVPKTGAWADLTSAIAALTRAADKFIHEILQTIDDGVRHVLVTGVPDIGIQPYYNGLVDEADRRAIATQYAAMLDGMIRSRIERLDLPSGVEFQYVSFTQMADHVLATLEDLFPGEVYPLNESSIVFFDKVHPTAELHAMAAAYLIDRLNGTMSGDALPLATPDYTSSGSIGVRGEVDTIILSLAAGTTYTLEMLGLSSLGGNGSVLADPLLTVTAPNGSILGLNDDGGAGLDSSFTFSTGAAGDHVISLTGVGSMIGTYLFQAAGAAFGDNVYTVTHSNAVILEGVGEGFDTVMTNVSYALGSGASIEVLRTNYNAGKAAINLTGNELAQKIAGNDGNNVIDGKGASDSIWGLAGKDVFVFSTAPGPANVDLINDYSPRDDSIWLDDAIFDSLGLGALASGAFVRGTAATQSDDRIIYDPQTGNLYFDHDGVGGDGQVLFATLSSGLRFGSSEFIVV